PTSFRILSIHQPLRRYLRVLPYTTLFRSNMKGVLNPNEIPHFTKINQWFADHTGWQVEVVPGLIPVEDFFMLLAQKKFPSSTWLDRKSTRLNSSHVSMLYAVFCLENNTCT